MPAATRGAGTARGTREAPPFTANMLRILLLLCIAATLATCGGDAAPERAPSNEPAQRVELGLGTRDPAHGSFGLSVPWPVAAGAWTGEIERVGSNVRTHGPASVRFPGEIVPRSSPALALALTASGPGSADVVIEHTRGSATRSLHWVSSGTLHARFELDGQTLEGLEVRFERLSGEAARGLEIAPPLLEFELPTTFAELLAGDASRKVSAQFGLESRWSNLLQPGQLWFGRGRVPADGARFELEYGVLDGSTSAALELRVVLKFESGAVIGQRIELTERTRWSKWTSELPARAGERFEVAVDFWGPSSGYALVALPAPLVVAPTSQPRTVLLVTSDTHRADHVEGVPRAVEIRTPALRELAARGVTFTDCWSSTNITVPSHVAMLSGLHPRDSGVTDNQTMLSDEPAVLPEVFREGGWATFAVTSINLLSPTHSGLGQGFDRVIAPLTTRTADKTVDAALRLLDETPDRSVFFWVHVFDAHGPYEPPPPFDERFYPAGRDPRDPNLPLEDGMRVPPNMSGVRDAEYVRAMYRGEVASADHQLARLFAHPRVRDGIVAFTGDHGEVLGRHGIWWAHKDVYPDTLHVPLILAWPGAPAGREVDTPVTNVDIARTLLTLATFEAQGFPGRVLATRDGPAELDSRAARFALGGGRTTAAITRDGWHLILQLRKSEEPEHKTHRTLHQVELFDLRADPECSFDRAAAETQRARELRAELVQWLAGWRGERFVGLKRTDAATLANLAQLGYASIEGNADASQPLIDANCTCEACSSWR